DIYDVELVGKEHLYWKTLDVDLHLDSIKSPKDYPLIAL
ncbi:MAG: DUF2442 domain-containing protein, partial [Nitrospinae bacterium]|nr:DUF2442 domain-containing protein [Nitrospinota bacterium]